MAITDINISEQLQTDAPSIKYTGNEGPQASPQHQQEQMIAQQIWEALSPEQQGQFQSFEQFFQSGIWKQILQQMQADEAQGPETQQGIGSLGPQPMQQQMPMPNRMGAQYGGRIGYRYGSPHSSEAADAYSSMVENDESTIMKKIQFLMSEFGLSKDEALDRVLNEFRKPRKPRRPRRPQWPPEGGLPEDWKPKDIGFPGPPKVHPDAPQVGHHFDINPLQTMEFRDRNQNKIEDRSEGIYDRPRDLVPWDFNKPKYLSQGGRTGIQSLRGIR